MIPIKQWLPELATSQSDVADVIASVFWELHNLDYYGKDTRQNSLSPEDIFWQDYNGMQLKCMRNLSFFLINPGDPITLQKDKVPRNSLWNEPWSYMMYPGYAARNAWIKNQGDINLLGCNELSYASENSMNMAKSIGAGERNKFVKTYTGYSPLFLLFALLRQNSDLKYMGFYFRKKLSKIKNWEVTSKPYKTPFLANLILEGFNVT